MNQRHRLWYEEHGLISHMEILTDFDAQTGIHQTIAMKPPRRRIKETVHASDQFFNRGPLEVIYGSETRLLDVSRHLSLARKRRIDQSPSLDVGSKPSMTSRARALPPPLLPSSASLHESSDG